MTLDMVGGDYTERNIVAAAEDGRIVQIATLGGADVKINIARLMMKRADADRLDAAAAHARGEGRLRARARGARSGRCWRRARSRW